MVDSECQYPPCTEHAAGSRYLVIDPEPVGVTVCAAHAAMIDRGTPGEDPDFWRWADAMMHGPDRG